MSLFQLSQIDTFILHMTVLNSYTSIHQENALLMKNKGQFTTQIQNACFFYYMLYVHLGYVMSCSVSEIPAIDVCLLCIIMELDDTLCEVLRALKNTWTKLSSNVTPEIMSSLFKIIHRNYFLVYQTIQHLLHLPIHTQIDTQVAGTTI